MVARAKDNAVHVWLRRPIQTVFLIVPNFHVVFFSWLFAHLKMSFLKVQSMLGFVWHEGKNNQRIVLTQYYG
jgi:hypothetical protein